MLTRPQQILLKRAQAQAGVDDEEYRDTLERLCGVRSSTDPAMSDEHLDGMLGYLEAIYWRQHDAGVLPAPCNRSAPFVQRDYWKEKNRRGNTSRDRYTGQALQERIDAAEQGLYGSGCSLAYVAAIRNRVCRGQCTAPVLRAYLAALERTLASRRNKANEPF